MRVFLVGEGPHDIGDLVNSREYRRGRPGFLQPIIEKLIGGQTEFDGAKVSLLGKRRVSRRAAALEAQAERAATLAINMESELLVFVRDLDRGRGANRRQAAADIRKMSEEIRRGSGCQPGADLTCVPGVACRTIEAWALGDGDAVAEACGLNGAVELPAGKGPEDLWGKPNDPDSNHPKMVLKRVAGEQPPRETFAAIGERASLDVVRGACPLSFEPFASDLEESL